MKFSLRIFAWRIVLGYDTRCVHVVGWYATGCVVLRYQDCMTQGVQQSVHKITTCDETTSTTNFLVPFFVLRMLVLIAQIKRFKTLNATQKMAALYKAPFLKKSRKTAGNWPFLTKNAFLTIFRQFFLIFSKTVLCRGLQFFCVVGLKKFKKKLIQDKK